MNNKFKFVLKIFICIQLLTFCNIKQSKIQLLPFYGAWNYINDNSNYSSANTEMGVYITKCSSIFILPTKGKKHALKEEFGMIHDIGWDLRIISITGNYPEYTIRFKYRTELQIINENFNETWANGELNIHFNNENEIWFELIKCDNLDKSSEIPKQLKFINYGPYNIYVRAEKLINR